MPIDKDPIQPQAGWAEVEDRVQFQIKKEGIPATALQSLCVYSAHQGRLLDCDSLGR